MVTVKLPAMVPEQTASWEGLLDLAERTSTEWTLVGGQLVHLHCLERGVSPARPTHDVDTVLNLRAYPTAFRDITSALRDLGFIAMNSMSTSNTGHRWIRGDAVIDVLIPGYLGSVKKDVHGARGVEAPGAQQALSRSERIEVDLNGRVAFVNGPSLLGALVGKAAALEILIDSNKRRHLADLAVLASLVRPADIPPRGALAKLDIRRLERAVNNLRFNALDVLMSTPGAEEGLERISQRLGAEPARDGIDGPSSAGRAGWRSGAQPREPRGVVPGSRFIAAQKGEPDVTLGKQE